MYKVGDKILYPTHGAGIIQEITRQKVLGNMKSYYIMHMPPDGMKVMIPVDTCDEIGIRFIISKEEGAGVLKRFRSEPIMQSENWNKRHRENMAKICSGDIYQVLGVVKYLMYMEKKKGLSTSERKMLNDARQIFVSELVMTEVAGRDDIESIMEDTIEELL